MPSTSLQNADGQALRESEPDVLQLDAQETTVAELQQAAGPRGFLKDHHLVALEQWLDSKFRVPGLGIRFGLDGLIGLIPGVGDLATTGMSAVFVADALKMGARKRVVAKMAANVALDMTLGAIPVVGDLFDFAFRSNTKNLALLKIERERLAREQA